MGSRIISFFSSWWLMYKTRRRPIILDDLPPLPDDLSSEKLTDNLEAAFNSAKGKSTSSRLRRAVWQCFCWRYLLAGFLVGSADMSKFATTITLRFFLLTESVDEKWQAGLVMILLLWYDCLAMQFYEHVWRNVAAGIKISVRGLMFRRLFKKSRVKNEGHLANVVTSDLEKIWFVARTTHYIWITPLFIISLAICVPIQYGLHALCGLPILLTFAVLSLWFAKLAKDNIKNYSLVTDLRLNATQQSINAIYSVKASQMEKAILQLIEGHRKRELWYLLRFSIMDSCGKNTLFYTVKLPIIAAIVASCLLVDEGAVTSSYVFPLALLYRLAQDISTNGVSLGVLDWLNFKLATDRVAKFMEQEPLNQFGYSQDIVDNFCTNIIQNPAQFHVIVGTSGSGKSTFTEQLLTALSERKMNIAFSAQCPWLMSTTIRENILCGRSFDSKRYWQTVSVCQLSLDLAKMKVGDQTQVGDGGIRLSGGQKARVSLARAVYHCSSDIYVFDDPFKSLNSAVSCQIIKQVFEKFLCQHTRILIGSKHKISLSTSVHLYRLQWQNGLEKMDSSLMMKTEDVSDESGSDEVEEANQISKSPRISKAAVPLNGLKKTEKDKQNKSEKDNIAKKIDQFSIFTVVQNLLCYFSYAPLWMSLSTLVLMILGQIVLTLTDIWLFFWVKCEKNCHPWYFFEVYTVLSVVAIALCVARSLFSRYLCCAITRNMHNLAINNVMRAPMKFFWTAESGEVHSRFSTDMYYLDIEIPCYLDMSLHGIIAIFAFCIVILCLFPVVILVLLASFLLLLAFWKFSFNTGQQLRILYATTLSPLVEQFSNVARGLMSAKALHLEHYLEQKFFNLSDHHSAPMLASLLAQSLLINAVGLILCVLLTVLIILLSLMDVKASIAGLTLYYGIQMISRSRILAYVSEYLHLIMIHFKRISDYTHLPTEHDVATAADDISVADMSSAAIVTDKVRVKYDENSDWAISDVSLSIQGGKITGIAGRTGCGKSTFLSALLRLVEFKGSILIGNHQSQASASLNKLRSCFAMLPQDSMIFFRETLRWNLDPFNRCSEEVIWEVLEILQMKKAINRLSLGLETLAIDAELSSGQMRLLCFSRVLLNAEGKILLLDEPTDSVDLETENIIWETIRKKLQNRTILVVAHSRDLLKKCSKIIQMDAE